MGGFLAGFERQDGCGQARTAGVVGGAIYGIALLVAHAIAGTRREGVPLWAASSRCWRS